MQALLAVPFFWVAAASPFATQPTAGKPAAVAADANEETVITAVFADPGAPSGYLATAVEISAATMGLTADYYIPFMSLGQAKPSVGQTCKISWRWHDGFDWVTARGSVRGVRLVTSYSCEGGPRGSF